MWCHSEKLLWPFFLCVCIFWTIQAWQKVSLVGQVWGIPFVVWQEMIGCTQEIPLKPGKPESYPTRYVHNIINVFSLACCPTPQRTGKSLAKYPMENLGEDGIVLCLRKGNVLSLYFVCVSWPVNKRSQILQLGSNVRRRTCLGQFSDRHHHVSQDLLDWLIK